MQLNTVRGTVRAAFALLCVVICSVALLAQQQLPRPLTDEQKVHAVFHESQYPSWSSVLESGGVSFRSEFGAPNPGDAVSLDSFFLDRVCSADLVVIGSVLAKHAFLTESKRMIFTDYHLAVKKVLRASRPIPGKTIGITRPGGTIAVPGSRTVEVRLHDVPELATTGEYLLFLRPLDGTRFFIPMDRLHTVRDDAGHARIHPTGRWSPWEFFTKPFSVDEIATMVASAAERCRP